MESPYGSNSKRVSKASALKVSPINAQRELLQLIGDANFRSPRNQSFDLENSDPALTRYYRSGSPKPPLAGNVVLNPAVESPNYLQMIAHQYLRGNSSKSGGSSPFGSRGSLSLSPLSSVENLEPPSPIPAPLFKTPVKVEEDVLVMDGILVSPGSGGRARSSILSSTSGSSSSGSNHSFYKSCEDSSGSRSSSKCQFSRGKEEMRVLRFPSKNKFEAQACKSYTGPSSCSYGAKCRFSHHQIAAAASPTELALTPVALRKFQTPTKPGNPSDSSSSAYTNNRNDSKKNNSSSSCYYTSTDWCPLDDGIGVAFPSASIEETPGKKAVNAFIHNVLYGPSRRNRLAVFAAICPS